ncbi:MAG TPA: HipA domain-containing protein [Sulfuricurvum sp.]|nr:MAG: hypothetical protein B7Y30_10735 [Campylobacterales bacterium 16-40-21]OZA02095.1 MAG: hypothetical protein B7X89_10805 [Sulfuricurvum sp. 17-40-25]HQS67746.1 HipA domain-containing protein [Sulfuricurvum sp.]HQT37467.1 HipA domain-containing protein [Sulfuricurvum sp.]
MTSPIDILLFDQDVAKMYEDGNNVWLKQYETKAHKASPISIPKDEIIDTSSLVFQDRVAGFISDAMPGVFGKKIQDEYFLKYLGRSRASVSDRLLFIADRALGALSFAPPTQRSKDIDETVSLKEMYEISKNLENGIITNASVDNFTVAAHSAAGGARAKAVVGINLDTKDILMGHNHGSLPEGFMRAIVKYDDDEKAKKSVYSKLEYIYSVIAKKSGINMTRCELVDTEDGRSHFVTERFDNIQGDRMHVHSLAGLLHVDFSYPMQTDYEDMFRVALQLGATASINQLFKQMIFNYMLVNQDDHSRNFSFMMNPAGQWSATPAYDLTYSNGEKQTSEHQLSFRGKALSAVHINDIFESASNFNINNDELIKFISQLSALRESELPAMIKEHDLPKSKYDQVMNSVSVRTFGGVL